MVRSTLLDFWVPRANDASEPHLHFEYARCCWMHNNDLRVQLNSCDMRKWLRWYRLLFVLVVVVIVVVVVNVVVVVVGVVVMVRSTLVDF